MYTYIIIYTSMICEITCKGAGQIILRVSHFMSKHKNN